MFTMPVKLITRQTTNVKKYHIDSKSPIYSQIVAYYKLAYLKRNCYNICQYISPFCIIYGTIFREATLPRIQFCCRIIETDYFWLRENPSHMTSSYHAHVNNLKLLQQRAGKTWKHMADNTVTSCLAIVVYDCRVLWICKSM